MSTPRHPILPAMTIELIDPTPVDAPSHITRHVRVNGQYVLVATDGIAVTFGDRGEPIVTLRLLPSDLHYLHEPPAPTEGA